MNTPQIVIITCAILLSAILLGAALWHAQRQHNKRCAVLRRHLAHIEEMRQNTRDAIIRRGYQR